MADLRGQVGDRRVHLGFGRIVASEIEAPNMSVNLAKVDERWLNATTRPSPECTADADSAERASVTPMTEKCLAMSDTAIMHCQSLTVIP
jgi:hypothetical protein